MNRATAVTLENRPEGTKTETVAKAARYRATITERRRRPPLAPSIRAGLKTGIPLMPGPPNIADRYIGPCRGSSHTGL